MPIDANSHKNPSEIGAINQLGYSQQRGSQLVGHHLVVDIDMEENENRRKLHPIKKELNPELIPQDGTTAHEE